MTATFLFYPEALVAAMDEVGLNELFFFGDDITDEEIFQLRYVDLFGVHIGKDDWTAASYYLNSPSEILNILDYKGWEYRITDRMI